jgi:hypothetical protein
MTLAPRSVAVSLVLGSLPVLLLLGRFGLVSAASGGWTITRTPSSVTQGVATNISFTATNISGGSDLGCVHLQAPSAFTVNVVVVDSVSGSRNWTTDAPSAGTSGSTILWVHAVTKADVIKVNGDTATFHVQVTGTTVGSYTWPVDSRDDEKCKSGIDSASVSVSIVAGAPTLTPAPTATPKPRPSPTPTPTQSPVSNPTATPRATTRPSATPAGDGPVASSDRGLQSSSPSASPSISGSHASSGIGAPPPPPEVRGYAAGSDRFTVGLGGPDQGPAIDQSIVTSSLRTWGGLLVWAVPSLVLSVPGLLLIVVIAAQVAGAAAWLPVVRRTLGVFGIGRRRDHRTARS